MMFFDVLMWIDCLDRKRNPTSSSSLPNCARFDEVNEGIKLSLRKVMEFY